MHRVTVNLLKIATASVTGLQSFALHATPVDGERAVPKIPAVGGAEILNLGLSMLIIIGAIIVVGWLYSRMKFVGNGASSVINVVASRPLGPKERLLLIEVAEQQLLVGITASQVQTLHVFDQPVVPGHAAIQTSGFAHRLRSALRDAVK